MQETLFPKKLGLEATKKTLNDLKLQNANKEKLAQEDWKRRRNLKKELKTEKVIVPIKVGEGGRTFGSISTKEIAIEVVKKQIGYDIDKKKIQLQDPIRELGTHIVPIKLTPESYCRIESSGNGSIGRKFHQHGRGTHQKSFAA